MQKESVSKQGRKTAKSKPTAHKDQAFDDPDDFGPIDYMETRDAHNEKGVSIEDQVSTVKPEEGTDKLKVSTDKIDEGTAELKNGNSDENATPTATLTVFGDDETIAEFLVSMSQNKAKQKGVEIKDSETLIGPKFLRKKLSQMLNHMGLLKLKKVCSLDNDEEIARSKVQGEMGKQKENKKLAEEEATKAALIRDYDDIQARIEADSFSSWQCFKKRGEKYILKREPTTS
ncbi:hypothetical protein Tco_0332440 [Tanacetum coccineum]